LRRQDSLAWQQLLRRIVAEVSRKSGTLSERVARALNGWQVSGTAFWHSGLPFSVLSAPYSANGNGIFQGSGPEYASVVPGVPLYERNPFAGITQPGIVQWLNPAAFVSAADPSTDAGGGGDSAKIASSAILAGARYAVLI
jgi:hypothetical protein